MSTCEICQLKLAGSYQGYQVHMKRYHGLESKAKALTIEPSKPMDILGDGSTGRQGSRLIMPVKITNRTFERIVQEKEWTLGKAVIPDTRPWKF